MSRRVKLGQTCALLLAKIPLVLGATMGQEDWEGLEGMESCAQGSSAPSRGFRGSEISIPGEPTPFIVPHPSVISFETRLQGSHLKSGHFNAMYHNVRLTAPAVSTCEGPVILLQGLPDVLYQASSCNSTNKWVLLTFLYQRTGD